MNRFLHNCPAPAKLNLFLHVIGQKQNGYHLLQTVFQLIDFCDYLHFTCRNDDLIKRFTSNDQIPENTDLIIRAARLIQTQAKEKNPSRAFGVDIEVEKNIPLGGGLGGGSSDAATTLLVLNHLWNCHRGTEELMTLGLQLGADVPFFILGQNAYAEGIGEKLAPLLTPEGWFVVIKPPISVSTTAIFQSKELTRHTDPIKIVGFPGCYNELSNFGKNDLQAVATKFFPEIQEIIEELSHYGNSRMTGSGACVFAHFDNEDEAKNVAAHFFRKWKVWVVKGIQNHPLKNYLIKD